MEILAKSSASTNTTLNNFIQTTGQLITSNTQAIIHLEMQLAQLAMIVSEREKGKLSSQSEANLRTQNNQGPQQGVQINQLNAIHTLRSRK